MVLEIPSNKFYFIVVLPIIQCILYIYIIISPAWTFICENACCSDIPIFVESKIFSSSTNSVSVLNNSFFVVHPVWSPVLWHHHLHTRTHTHTNTSNVHAGLLIFFLSANKAEYVKAKPDEKHSQSQTKKCLPFQAFPWVIVASPVQSLIKAL